MSFLLSLSGRLSLMSFEACQVLIWSLYRWSFLISFFRSCSYFSFCWRFVEDWILSKMPSNVSTPSATFLRTLSISAGLCGVQCISSHSCHFIHGADKGKNVCLPMSFLDAILDDVRDYFDFSTFFLGKFQLLQNRVFVIVY